MVAGKVKAAMRFQRSHSTPKPPANATTNSATRVQSKHPPSTAELLRLVEELRERETQLRAELLEHKILKETVALVPFLEREVSVKAAELERSRQRILEMEAENRRLRSMVRTEEEVMEVERKIRGMESEIECLKRAVVAEQCRPRGVSSSSKSRSLSMGKEARSGVNGNLECTKHKSVEKETEIKSRTPRVPRPPPLPTRTTATSTTTPSSFGDCGGDGRKELTLQAPLPPPPPPPVPPTVVVGRLPSTTPPPPPPPPPPPLGLMMKPAVANVRRVPEVVEFYHSLMRRDSRRDSISGVPETPSSSATAKSMIGEIENRSAHLHAIKTDVETQGDFIRFLIKEVENAAFTNIEDVVAFVKWLDDELSFLVDERAVLKHFQWPEQKADAMREAAFGYNDLRKLELEASTFGDDARQHCTSALKKMQALLDKLEHGVYNLSRVREAATKKYKDFRIPWQWMQDSGFVSQIKLASVKLAMKYMKRVLAELEAVAGGPEEEELVLQGVRFAFRVHQFAGGFDVETMRAFQELRDKARSCQIQNQRQTFNHHRLICRSTSC